MSASWAVAGSEIYQAALSDQSGAAGIKVSVPPLWVRQDDTVTVASAANMSSSTADLLSAEEYIGALYEEYVLGNTGCVDAVEVGLEGGGDAAVLLTELGGECHVAVALGGQDQVGPCVDGCLGLLEVDYVETVGIAGEG